MAPAEKATDTFVQVRCELPSEVTWMTRNGKRRPPSEEINARIEHQPLLSQQRLIDLNLTGGETSKREAATYPYRARCGRCGQALPGVDNVLGLELWGWQLDGDVWRPTNHHRAQRQRAQKVASNAALSPAERERAMARVARSSFSRGRHIDGALRLNGRWIVRQKFECARCGAVNRLPHKPAPS